MALVAKMVLHEVAHSTGYKTRIRDDGEQVVLSSDGQWYGYNETKPEGVSFLQDQKAIEKLRFGVIASAGPDDPNKQWSAATPAGTMELTITNSDAHGSFAAGDTVYVEIRKARK